MMLQVLSCPPLCDVRSSAAPLSTSSQARMTGHFPTGADLVQVAVEFVNKVQTGSRNLQVLFTEPGKHRCLHQGRHRELIEYRSGHLPALLWAKAVETHFRQICSTPESLRLMDRIDYALADSFKHKYDKVSSTQAVCSSNRVWTVLKY